MKHWILILLCGFWSLPVLGAQQTLNNGETLGTVRGKINSNFTELYGWGEVTYNTLNSNGDIGTTAGTVAAGDDSRFPTTDEKAALAGTGTPAAGNPYVTTDDSRLAANHRQVADYTELLAVTGAGNDDQALVAYRSTKGDGGGGVFRWDTSDLSATLVLSTVTSTAVNDTTETITSTAHGLLTGDAVVSTTAVDGLTANTVAYWAIKVDDDNFKLADSYSDAQAGTARDLTGTTNFTTKKILDPLSGVYVRSDLTGVGGAWVRMCKDVRPEYFGAKGDGAIDDTLAIQMAFNSHPTASVVKIPVVSFTHGREYLASAELTLTHTAIIDGNGALLRSSVNTAGAAALKIGTTGTNTYRVKIVDFDVAFTSGTSASYGIELLNTQQTTISRCYISAFQTQIKISADGADPFCGWLTIDDCYFQGGTYGFDSSTVATNVATITNSRFIQHAKNAIKADPVTGLTIQNNDFSNCASTTGNAVILLSNNGQYRILDNYFEGNGDGAGGYSELIQLISCSSGVIRRNILNGANGAWDSATHVKHGIRGYSISNTTISDNHFTYFQGQSVLLDEGTGAGVHVVRNKYSDLQEGTGNKYLDLSGNAYIDDYQPPQNNRFAVQYVENYVGSPKEIADNWTFGADAVGQRNVLAAPFGRTGLADRIDFTGAGAQKSVTYTTPAINNTQSQDYVLRFYATLDSISNFGSELQGLRVKVYDTGNAVFLADEYVYLSKGWSYFEIKCPDAQVNSHAIQVQILPMDVLKMQFTFGLTGVQYARAGSPYVYGEQYSDATLQRDFPGTNVPYPLLLTKDAETHVIEYGAAVPTSGTYIVGDVVYNSAPVAGGKIGWVCTAGGTPGTWKAFGAIDP